MSQTANAIVTEKTDTAIVIHIKAKLVDENSSQQLIQTIDSAAGDAPQLPIVIDMAQVEFLPSLCLGALVHISNKCKSRSQKLKLAGVRPNIRKVFVITRLDRSFELYDSVEAALKV